MIKLETSILDVDYVVDSVHELIDSLRDRGLATDVLDDFGLEVLKIAVHEWVANLIQHAEFGNEEPRVWLEVRPNPPGVSCVIEDNSRGFDLARQIWQQERRLTAEGPPPERGRGLVLISACVADLRYLPRGARWASPDQSGRRQRLEFRVHRDWSGLAFPLETPTTTPTHSDDGSSPTRPRHPELLPPLP